MPSRSATPAVVASRVQRTRDRLIAVLDTPCADTVPEEVEAWVQDVADLLSTYRKAQRPVEDVEVDERVSTLVGELAKIAAESWAVWVHDEWPALATAIDAVTARRIEEERRREEEACLCAAAAEAHRVEEERRQEEAACVARVLPGGFTLIMLQRLGAVCSEGSKRSDGDDKSRSSVVFNYKPYVVAIVFYGLLAVQGDV
ncbi:hypothetical protein AcW1_000066 [Taiwanofungus camphoratus]|nr:hypothetical protein AcW2_001442 [Antrodia cinnamomea]KAI0962791.1 hypothetical protein AcW1_000066 [Antrodia cinnamomea]